MKRLFSLILVLTLSMGLAYAISDKEVMKTAMELYGEGYSEMDIAKALIKQGASVEQLQRLQSQLLSMRDGKSSSSSKKSDYLKSNSREDNGEELDSLLLWDMWDIEKPAKLVYGRDIFRTRSTSFKPQMNQATPKNYVLGPGDEVIIDIYGASQEQFEEEISPDGKITIEGYGPISLAGLTLSDATRRLRATLGSRYQSSQILLTIGQTRSITVNVMGEVLVPGAYQVSAFADVFQVLYLAGGVAETGTLRSIRVYRAGKQVSELDIYNYMMNGTQPANSRLEDGDVVIVGTYDALVEIHGKIKRPMFYEMKKGETLDKLLYYAGGFAGDAYTDGVRVNRRAAGAMSVHTIRNAAFESFAVMDGDSVAVDSILPRFRNTVEVRGAVFRPGFYGLDENLKTLRELIDMAGGVSEDAFMSRAVLYRMKLDRTFQAVPVALDDIMSGAAADVELRNEDQLYVPSQQEKLEKQYVVIHGEVYAPDTFRYAENESVEDLILRAGGLTDRASTSKVDVARRVIDPKATDESSIKSQTFTVELRDSLEVSEHGFILQPFDEVYVRMSPAYGKQMNVSVRGEILFDGTYSLKTQDDRLSDLVKAAGGLSSHAYAKGARLQRVMTEEERMRRDQLVRMNKAASRRDSVDIDKLDLGDKYFVGIDLESALKNPGSNEDIILREGDILLIPSQNTTVKINGEVCYPNTVSYISGKRARYYVNQAGGYSSNARRLKVYIIYPNGRVGTKCSKIQPGCEIVVPSRPERKSGNAAQSVAIASSAASIASVAATIVTVIVNTSKK